MALVGVVGVEDHSDAFEALLDLLIGRLEHQSLLIELDRQADRVRLPHRKVRLRRADVALDVRRVEGACVAAVVDRLPQVLLPAAPGVEVR